MKEVIGKRFFRNDKYNVMFGVVAFLNAVPFVVFLVMGSPAGMSNLVLTVLFVVLAAQKNKPLLTFQKSYVEYKASALGSPMCILYTTIESTNTYGNKLIIRIKSKAKPVSIPLYNFNKSQRSNIVECFSKIKTEE